MSPLLAPRVNVALSRGLAGRAVRALGDQGMRYRQCIRPIVRQRVRTKKGVTKTVNALRVLGERTSLIQTIGSSPNGRHVCVCHFVPFLEEDAEGRRRNVAFTLHQFRVEVDGLVAGRDYGSAIVATEHAVERLFL
jgi:hypothetical protein